MTPKIFKLSSIKPHKDNPRLIRDENFEKLKKSIIDFPKMLELRPIIVDENNVILGGNMRYKALKELGYKEFRLVSTTDAIPDKKELLKIKKRAFKFLKSGYNSYIYNLDTKTESFSE